MTPNILLPINETLLNTHTADCWAFYCYLYKSTTRTICNFSPNAISIHLTLDAGKSMSGRIFSGLGQSIWNKYKHEWPQDKLLIVNEPTTMLRLDVFEKAHSKILPLAARSPAFIILSMSSEEGIVSLYAFVLALELIISIISIIASPHR